MENKYPNIVVFGATGSGKSSIINLIAGQTVSPTSNGMLGCTFEHKSYDVWTGGLTCRLWDTTGLGEGTEGSVSAPQAEENLKCLVEKLDRGGGINLLLYCVRSGRITKTLQRNYDVFYSKLCRRKVPIALVVTHLEHQEESMDTWWYQNENALRGVGLHFDAHACVTALDYNDPEVQRRRVHSQSLLRNLVLQYSCVPSWKIGQSFISQMFPIFHNLIRPTPSTDRPLKSVIICDMAEDSVVECLPGIPSSWQRCVAFLEDQKYEFVRLDKRLLVPVPDTRGLLVFYTSGLVNDGLPCEDMDTLKKFYDVGGGSTYPMIIVFRGCESLDAAQALWKTIISRLGNISAYPAPLSHTVDQKPKELMMMIRKLCIDPALPALPSHQRSRFYEALLVSIIRLIRSKQVNDPGKPL